MAVQIFSGGTPDDYGVLTNASSEETFLGEIAECISEAVVDAFCAAPETMSSSDAKARAISGAAVEVEIILEKMVEIVLKYRGYKSEAIERKEIFSGDRFPKIGERTPAWAYEQTGYNLTGRGFAEDLSGGK